MEAPAPQPVSPAPVGGLFSQAKIDALRRLRDTFEEKLLDEDEYKAEKQKVLNATPAAAPAPADDDGFELVGVQTEAERAAEARRRAEAEGNVLEIDDDDEPAAAADGPRAGQFRAPERRSTRYPEVPAAPRRRNPRRGEERVMLRCRRVYFGTALRRDVAVVFAPSGVIMEWRSDMTGLNVEARLAPSHMTSFDMYHGQRCGAGGASLVNLVGNDEMPPDAIREFFAIGLRQKPPHLRSLAGFEPTDDEGPRKYVVVVLEGDALATFKREAVPTVVWAGHTGWPAAPVLGTALAARPFLEGIADALAAGDAAEDAAALRPKPATPARKRPRRDVARSGSSPAPAADDPTVAAKTKQLLADDKAIKTQYNDGTLTVRTLRRAVAAALGVEEAAIKKVVWATFNQHLLAEMRRRAPSPLFAEKCWVQLAVPNKQGASG